MILNYFTFLPAILMLNQDDFQLFSLPTCHPGAELRWCWTILPSYLPSWCLTKMLCNYFASYLPSRCWTKMIFELIYLPTYLTSRCWTKWCTNSAINLKTFKTKIATKHKFSCAKTVPLETIKYFVSVQRICSNLYVFLHHILYCIFNVCNEGETNITLCFSASYTVLYFRCLKGRYN